MPATSITVMSPSESGISKKASEPDQPAHPTGGSGRWYHRVLVVLLCLELGLFLLAFPWSILWERNLIFQYLPFLRPLFLNHYFRGAVSGLGLINLWFGLSLGSKFLPPAVSENREDFRQE